ncbi:MBL fold metallo-hydrolase [Pseudomonas sp. AMR01]|uniref:MBL fold metallo-hydrolase n=1 Tax=Pseudomonas sp. AMR01 TaxID=3064904 RepID=UPI0035C03999
MNEKLNIKVFNNGDEHDGFGVNSTIIYGPTEAMIVDAQFTLANAHRLAAEAIEVDRKISLIFITHMHPDHFLGLSVLHEAFPEARVIAFSNCADQINSAYDFKIEYWGYKVLGRNGSKSKVFVERFDDSQLLLDGFPISFFGPMRGDASECVVVWIQSIRTLIAADTVFDKAHVWLADARTPEMRDAWLETLALLESLKPEIVVPGHSPKHSSLSPKAINFTRQYILDFEAQWKLSNNSKDLIERMDALYPELPVKICLEYGAKILKDQWCWDGDWPESLRHTKSVI